MKRVKNVIKSLYTVVVNLSRIAAFQGRGDMTKDHFSVFLAAKSCKIV